jgi:branched-subunit amino acid transport protein
MPALAVILLVGIASFVPRYLPFVVLRGREPSPVTKDLLGYAPVAVLAALVVPFVLKPTGGGESLVTLAPYLAGTAVVVLVAAFSKRLLVSTAGGTVVFFVVRMVMGA